MSNSTYSRRDFLRTSIGVASSSAMTGTCGLLYSNRVAAEPITIAIALIAAITSFVASRSKSGLGRTLSALNLKLDQVLHNQITIMNALGVLQSSIDRLQRDIPGFITNESFRLLWEGAYSEFKAFKLLNERSRSAAEKVADYKRIFQRTYDNINLADSRIATSTTGVKGVASVLAGCQAVLLFMDTLYAMANFEQNLPSSERWKDSRAAKFDEMASLLFNAARLLSVSRISEAITDQTALRIEAATDGANTYWGKFMEKLRDSQLPFGLTEPGELDFLVWYEDLCFTARPPYNQIGMWETVDLAISYKSQQISLSTPAVVVYDVKLVPDSVKRRFWVYFKDGSWRSVSPEVTGGINNIHYCRELKRDGIVDQSRPELIPAELDLFSATLERYAQAIVNLKILEDLRKACELLLREVTEFRKKIAAKSDRND